MNLKTKQALNKLEKSNIMLDHLADGEFTTKMASEQLGISNALTYHRLKNNDSLAYRTILHNGHKAVAWKYKEEAV